MVEFSDILLAITALFIVFFALRFTFNIKLCTLCAAVSTTWIGLLVISLYGISVDSLAIGILMGGSVVGVMYFLENSLRERWSMLKLPFILTLFTLVYVLLSGTPGDITSYMLLLAIWAVFIFVFALQNKGKLKGIGRKLIECCKNW